MFGRADQKLIQNKRRRNRKNVGRTVRGEDAWMKKGIDIDMKRIRRELAEQELLQGAYCQDYDTFKNIYRFVERRLRRTQSSVYIILLTLTDGRGEFPELTDREENMEILEGIIQNSLRLGECSPNTAAVSSIHGFRCAGKGCGEHRASNQQRFTASLRWSRAI